MAIYYSHGLDGVPYGQRYPSEQMARAYAQKAMGEFSDLDKVEILKITTQSFGYEYRKTPKNPEVAQRVQEILKAEPNSPFEGISLL